MMTTPGVHQMLMQNQQVSLLLAMLRMVKEIWILVERSEDLDWWHLDQARSLHLILMG